MLKAVLRCIGGAFLALILLSSNQAFADSKNITASVEIAGAGMELTLTGNNPITLNLNPDTKTYDTDYVDLKVATSNASGYKLFMYTGDDDTTLKRVATDGVEANIPTLDPNTSYANMDSFPANHWGYKQNSGNFVPYESPKEIMSNSSPTNGDTTRLTFGSKVDYDQKAGNYSTSILFQATANVVTGDYMQDFTNSMCAASASDGNYTVVDKRDGNEYAVRYINGNCWMTQNLRYVGDTGSTDGRMKMRLLTSNINRDKTVVYKDLDSSINLDGDYDTNDYARLHVATDGQVPAGATYTAKDIGVWYNYAAATAETITGSDNSTEATQDICPAGWRLPTNSQQMGIIGESSAYAPIGGGQYALGRNLSVTYTGVWWSSISDNTNSEFRYILRFNSDNISLRSTSDYRVDGYYVRCVRKGIATITFDGNGADDGSMSTQVVTSASALNPNAFTRTNYIFVGWNTARDGSGTSYADGGIYTSEASDTSITLYAQWYNGSSIQDFTKSMCSSSASSHSVDLIDIRDNNIYSVLYIEGSGCWMTQNLRYVGDIGSTSGFMTMKAATSNISTDKDINYKDLDKNINLDGDYYTYDYARLHVATSGQVPSGATYTASDMGVWYNYAAATAGTIKGSSGNNTDATYDICPKGWHLPNADKQAGVVGYSSQYNTIGGGRYATGEILGNTVYGYWWSSEMVDTKDRVYMYGYNRNLYANKSGDRRVGHYIRCVRTT